MGVLLSLLVAIIGVSWGLTVGLAFSAVITILRVMPRLMEVTGTRVAHRVYETALTAGAVLASVLLWTSPVLRLGDVGAVIVGALAGIWVGLLAAALAEVINAIPIAGRRIGLRTGIAVLIASLALGKVIGSLIFWNHPSLWGRG